MFWYAKILTQDFLTDLHIWFSRFLYILGCSGPHCDACLSRSCPEGARKVSQRLPGGCWRLPRGCTKVARRISGGFLKVSQTEPGISRNELIYALSFIHGLRSVPLVWQTFCEVGQNNSWKCKVLLLCNTKASRQIMMSWCLQCGLISASKYVPSFDIQ